MPPSSCTLAQPKRVGVEPGLGEAAAEVVVVGLLAPVLEEERHAHERVVEVPEDACGRRRVERRAARVAAALGVGEGDEARDAIAARLAAR